MDMKSMGSDLCLAGEMGSIGHLNDTYHRVNSREEFRMESQGDNLMWMCYLSFVLKDDQ